MRRSLALIVALVPFSLANAFPHEGCFRAAARLHGVPTDLLIAVAEVESGFQASAMSDASAHGVMQIRWPVTARHLGARRPAELYNPCRNIELGARYLAELIARYGDERRALAAYNYGPTRIDAAGSVPAGALAYVERVQRARTRIAGSLPAMRSTRLTFSSRYRAERYARAINAQLSQPAVQVHPVANGAAVALDSNAEVGASDRRLLISAGLLEVQP